MDTRELDLRDKSISDDNLEKKLEKFNELNFNSIDLGENPGLTDVSVLNNCCNLIHLDLRGTGVTSLNSLSEDKLNKLESLYLSETEIEDFSFLEKCINLKKLYLTDTSISNKDLKYIEGIVSIEELSLTATQINKDLSALSKLINLKKLYLNEVDVDAISILQLKSLINLEYLEVDYDPDLQYTKDELFKELRKLRATKIPGLTIFSHVKNSAPSSKESLDGKDSTEKRELEIYGELLESFDEIILGELEMLADINDDETKRLLLDILFDPTVASEEVAKYASVIDSSFGKRFVIVYCCMHPHRWEDDYVRDFKNSLIVSYVRNFMSDDSNTNPVLFDKKPDWLKSRAKHILEKFFAERDIKKIKLAKSEQEKKEKILNKIVNIQSDLTLDIKIIEQEKSELKELINSENNKQKFIDILNNPILFKPAEAISYNPSKLMILSDEWKDIYNLIKCSPSEGRTREENKMLEIIRAIIYKEEKKCRWKDLPQSFPRETTVRYYYYQWKSIGIVEQIKNILSKTLKENSSEIGSTSTTRPGIV